MKPPAIARSAYAVVFTLFAMQTCGAVTREVPSQFPKIQDAIDASASADTVLVSTGVYTGPGNRGLDFHGVDLILLSEEGAEQTIIDCEGEDQGFHLHSGETPAATIDGFMIRNGMLGPGAVHLVDASPTIRNCRIIGNAGPGIEATVGWPRIIDCVISENGGIGVYSSGKISLTDCIISENNPGGLGWGGGIRNSGGEVLLERCTVTRNRAQYGGGLASQGYNSRTRLTDCIVSENEATDGGGLWKDTSAGLFTLLDSSIHSNRAERLGGGVYSAPYHLYLGGCSFRGNTAEDGGAIYAPYAEFDICVIAGNLARSSGGGIYMTEDVPVMRSSTVVGNRALGGMGGGLFIASSRYGGEISESIFWGNCAAAAGEIGMAEDLLHLVCCIVDSSDVGGAGSISYDRTLFVDPIFAAPLPCEDAPTLAGNYAPVEGSSPCLDSCGNQIGAIENPACPEIGFPTLEVSWGTIKSLYR